MKPIVVLSGSAKQGMNRELDEHLNNMGYVVIYTEKPSDLVVRSADVADVVNANDVATLRWLITHEGDSPLPVKVWAASLAKRLADVLGVDS